MQPHPVANGSIRPIRALLPLLFLAAMALLAGCQSEKNFYGRLMPYPLDTAVPKGDAELTRLHNVYAHIARTIKQLDQTPDVDIRNRTLTDMISLSNHFYEQFAREFQVANATTNSTFDLTSIGLSAAATLVAGPAAKALSAADTALKAAQGKLDDRWLATKTIPALVNIMDADRAAALKNIYTMMKTTDYKSYDLHTGMQDVRNYHDVGTVLRPLASLDATSATAKTQNQKDANDIKSGNQNKNAPATTAPATKPAS